MEHDLQLQLFNRDSAPPTPPGDFIRSELERLGWGQEDLARVMGRPLPTINKIIKGSKSITPETALELARAFGTSPDFWLTEEAAYRLSLAEAVHADYGGVERRAKLYAKAPVKEMVKRRWILPPESPQKAEEIVCRFLEIATLDGTPQLFVNARSSTPGCGFTSDQAVWCHRAYHISQLIKPAQYKRAKISELKGHLRALSNLAKNVQHVPKLMSDYGIRLVALQHLPGTRIDGAAFWLDEKSPVIAMALRYDRVNHFWQVLGHEVSHIFHCDADVDSDSFELIQEKPEREKRADTEGAATFIDESEMASFIKRVSPLYTKKRIIQFANRLSVHPSIVVGQLQFRGELDWSQGTQLHTKYRDALLETALTDGWGRFLPPFK